MLEDTDNDGKMDKRTVFADGLVQARAVKALDHGILVLEPPNVWLMHDTNGDLKMDTKELVGTDYGRREGGVEGNANSFQWGLDNYLHSAGSNVTYSLRLKDGVFDRRPTLSRGEWGVSRTISAACSGTRASRPCRWTSSPTPYYARNPSLVRSRGSYEVLTNDVNNINEVWPVRPNPGTNRSYQVGITRPSDGTVVQVTAACTPLVFRGDRLPPALYGNVFVAEPTANFVRRHRARRRRHDPARSQRVRQGGVLWIDRRAVPAGVPLERPGRDADGGGFLPRRDPGPRIDDGLPEGLHPEEEARRADRRGHGPRLPRRPRLRAAGSDAPQLSRATPAQLVQALSHPNGWWRDTAQRLLVERGVAAVVAELKALATGDAPPPRA